MNLSQVTRIALASTLAVSALHWQPIRMGQAAGAPRITLAMPGLCNPNPFVIGECGLLQNPQLIASEPQGGLPDAESPAYLEAAGSKVLSSFGRAMDTFSCVQYSPCLSSYLPSNSFMVGFNYAKDWQAHPSWYHGRDTWQSISISATALSGQIRALRTQYGDNVIVDIVAHSLGGSVATYWAATESDPQNLGVVRSVVTFSSPVGGVDSTFKKFMQWLGCVIIIQCVDVVRELELPQVKALMAIGTTQVDVANLGNEQDDVVPGVSAVLVAAWQHIRGLFGCKPDCHGGILHSELALTVASASFVAQPPLWTGRQFSGARSSMALVGSDRANANGGMVRLLVTAIDGVGHPIAGRFVAVTSSRNSPSVVDVITVAPGYGVSATCQCGVTNVLGQVEFRIASTVAGSTTVQAYFSNGEWVQLGAPTLLTFLAAGASIPTPSPAAGSPSSPGTPATATPAPAAVPAATIPQPALPLNNSQLPGLSTSLSWANAAGTTQVQVQVTPLGGDGPGLNVIVGSAVTSYEVPAPVFGRGPYLMLPGATYSWRVRTSTATASIGETDASWGPWSDARSFTTARPNAGTIELVAPTGGGIVASNTPTVSWRDANSAMFYYEVQLSSDPNFGEQGPKASVYSNLVHAAIANPPDSWRVPNSAALPTGIYYWRVRQRLQATAAGAAETGIAWTPAAWFVVP